MNTETTEQIRQRLHRELPRLADQYAVRSLGMFGSYVRGEQKRGSDLDLLVEFDQVPGIVRFLELEEELSKITGKRVDLVHAAALKPAISRRILAEVRDV